MRTFAALLVLLLAACSTPSQDIRLIPVPLSENEPVVCKVTSVTPGTPADQVDIEPDDEIRQIGDARFTSVSNFFEVLNAAPGTVRIVVARAGKERETNVALEPAPPRLGVVCDMVGGQDIVKDAEGRHFAYENRKGVTVFANAETLRGILFVRVGVENFRDEELHADAACFTANDGSRTRLAQLPPAEAMKAMHGEDVARVLASQRGPATTAVPANRDLTLLLRSAPFEAWTLDGLINTGGREAPNVDADFILANSLGPVSIRPGEAAKGAVYFAEPNIYPFQLMAEIGGERFEFHFEESAPSD